MGPVLRLPVILDFIQTIRMLKSSGFIILTRRRKSGPRRLSLHWPGFTVKLPMNHLFFT